MEPNLFITDPNQYLRPSSSDRAAVIDNYGWNIHSEGSSRDHHREPTSGEKAKMTGKTRARRALPLSLKEGREGPG
jgi:hypothetical protein